MWQDGSGAFVSCRAEGRALLPGCAGADQQLPAAGPQANEGSVSGRSAAINSNGFLQRGLWALAQSLGTNLCIGLCSYQGVSTSGIVSYLAV